MRYTEREYVRPSFSDKSSLVKYFVTNIAIAPYRLCKEISNKVIYLGKSEVIRIFNCASVMDVLLMLPDVYRMATERSVTAGGASAVAKALALGGIVSIRLFYESKAEKLVDLKIRDEEDEVIPTAEEVQTIGVQEEVKVVESAVYEEQEIDLSELLEEGSDMSEEEQEFSRQVSCDLLESTFYPSTEAKDLLNSQELSYSTRMAFSIERDFLNMSAEESIAEIAQKMYSDPQAEYSAEDEALSFQDIEDLLMF